MLRVHRLETDKWSWGFLRMNLLKFLPVKMSALVFRSIKHMSLTFFFPESPLITYCSWGTVKTCWDGHWPGLEKDWLQRAHLVSVWTGFHCDLLLGNCPPTPLLGQHLELLILAQGRGRWAVFQKHIMIRIIYLSEILAYNKSALCRSASPVFSFVLCF